MKKKFSYSGLLITPSICLLLICNFSETHALFGLKKKNRIASIATENDIPNQLLQKLQDNHINQDKTSPYIEKLLSLGDFKAKIRLLRIIETLIKNKNFPGILFLITHENAKISQTCITKLEDCIKELVTSDQKTLELLLSFLAKSTNDAKLSQQTYINILRQALIKTAAHNKKVNRLFRKSTTKLDLLYDAIDTSISKPEITDIQEKLACKLWLETKASKNIQITNELFHLKKLSQLLTHVAAYLAKQDEKTNLKDLFESIVTSPVIHKNFYNVLHDTIIKISDDQKALDCLCDTIKPIIRKEKIGEQGKNKALNTFVTLIQDLIKTNNPQKLLLALITNHIDLSIITFLKSLQPQSNTINTILEMLEKVRQNKEEHDENEIKLFY